MIPPCSRHSPFARTGGVCLMRLFLTASLVVLLARPALADFPAAQASLRQSDYAAAYDGCKVEAERGDPECQNLVGYLFQQGLGVTANPNEAVRLFRLAAAKNLAGAQINLGRTYQEGLGLAKDDVQAAHWYQLAAAQHEPVGEFYYALMLLAGRGVDKDFQKAGELLRQAADRAYMPAQLTLALALERAGGSVRAVQAYTWYRIATRLAKDAALRTRANEGQNRMIMYLSGQELVAARTTADNWKPSGPKLEFTAFGSTPVAPQDPAGSDNKERKPSATGSDF